MPPSTQVQSYKGISLYSSINGFSIDVTVDESGAQSRMLIGNNKLLPNFRGTRHYLPRDTASDSRRLRMLGNLHVMYRLRLLDKYRAASPLLSLLSIAISPSAALIN